MNAEQKLPLLVYGSRDYGQLVALIAVDCGFRVAGHIDDTHTGDGILGNWDAVCARYPPADYNIAIGIGYNNLKARRALVHRCIDAGYRLPPLVHPRAIVHSTTRVAAGAVIMLGAILDVRAIVGTAAVCWPGSVISHDSALGENSFLSPNATICGNTTTGHSCFIGGGAVVTDHVTMPDTTFLKAGSRYGGARDA